MQINLKLDCTLYTGLGVHFYRNIQCRILVCETCAKGAKRCCPLFAPFAYAFLCICLQKLKIKKGLVVKISINNSQYVDTLDYDNHSIENLKNPEDKVFKITSMITILGIINVPIIKYSDCENFILLLNTHKFLYVVINKLNKCNFLH